MRIEEDFHITVNTEHRTKKMSSSAKAGSMAVRVAHQTYSEGTGVIKKKPCHKKVSVYEALLPQPAVHIHRVAAL